MDESISSRYEMTEADYVDVIVAHFRYIYRRPVFRCAWWLFFGFVLLMMVSLPLSNQLNPGLTQEEKQRGLLRVAGVVLGLWVLVYLSFTNNLLNRIYYRRSFRAVPEASRLIEWGCDPEMLWSRTSLASATYRWELFGTIVETPNCFLFYQGDQFSLWLPGHGFSSPGMLRIFTDLARAKVPHYVVLGECRFPAKPAPVGLNEL